jgi:hypothetical protein
VTYSVIVQWLTQQQRREKLWVALRPKLETAPFLVAPAIGSRAFIQINQINKEPERDDYQIAPISSNKGPYHPTELTLCLLNHYPPGTPKHFLEFLKVFGEILLRFSG